VKALMSALSPDADLICRRGIRETIVDGVNKLLIDDLSKGAEYTKAFVEALGDVRPVSTLLGSPERLADLAGFACEDLGPQQLRGRAAAMKVYAVTAKPSRR